MEKKKEVKLSLVFRDMWQSAGKYVPRVDQLVRVAPAIIQMGCFDRVETNGGGFEQVNLLFGENPNKAVREWTKPFHEAGIQTHMLDRALNGLRMSPVPADVRRLFYKVKKAQGTDIARTFCGLNDIRNIAPSIEYAKAAGMISQCCLCITHSPIHTVGYYVDMAKKLIDLGCDEICLKDMAGIGRPATLGKICAGIKAYRPDIIIQYHSHSGPGFNMASILEVCKNGCDYIDTAIAPLAWGTGHADILAVQAMLRDAGFEVKDVNMMAYMEVRSQIQAMMDDFLGLYCNPLNRINNNKWKEKHGHPLLTQDDLLIKLFDEVAYIWPKLGYPCLVTPFSQYVKNLALMNVMQMEKGKERWSMIADDIWDMILGKAGQLPGPVAPEIQELAKAQGRTFITTDPQANYPDELNKYRQLMAEKGWETGQDDEELFEYAMHPSQYEAYKSGKAKEDFLDDVAKRKAELQHPAPGTAAPAAQPEKLVLTVDGKSYEVHIAYDGAPANAPAPAPDSKASTGTASAEGEAIPAPLEGKFYRVKSAQETAKDVGDSVQRGDIIGYIEAMKTYNAIRAEFDGTITEIVVKSGDSVEEDDVLMKIARK